MRIDKLQKGGHAANLLSFMAIKKGWSDECGRDFFRKDDVQEFLSYFGASEQPNLNLHAGPDAAMSQYVADVVAM